MSNSKATIDNIRNLLKPRSASPKSDQRSESYSSEPCTAEMALGINNQHLGRCFHLQVLTSSISILLCIVGVLFCDNDSPAFIPCTTIVFAFGTFIMGFISTLLFRQVRPHRTIFICCVINFLTAALCLASEVFTGICTFSFIMMNTALCTWANEKISICGWSSGKENTALTPRRPNESADFQANIILTTESFVMLHDQISLKDDENRMVFAGVEILRVFCTLAILALFLSTMVQLCIISCLYQVGSPVFLWRQRGDRITVGSGRAFTRACINSRENETLCLSTRAELHAYRRKKRHSLIKALNQRFHAKNLKPRRQRKKVSTSVTVTTGADIDDDDDVHTAKSISIPKHDFTDLRPFQNLL